MEAAAAASGGTSPSTKVSTGAGYSNFVRGLEPGRDLDLTALAKVGQFALLLRKRVNEQCVPMLERWLRLALKDQAMEAACTIYAHLAYR